MMESLEDVGPPLVADGEPAEASEPGQCSLDDPAMPTEPLGAVHPAPGDAWRDPALPAGVAAARIVVSLVGMQLVRATPRPAHALPNRRHGVDQGLEKLTVVRVGRAETDREWDAVAIDDDVALAARFAA